MDAVLEGWKSGAAAVQSVFRRSEYDWTIVSLLDSSYSMTRRHGGINLVSMLDSGSSGPGSSPGWGHCVLFLVKTPSSCSAVFLPSCTNVYRQISC